MSNEMKSEKLHYYTKSDLDRMRNSVDTIDIGVRKIEKSIKEILKIVEGVESLGILKSMTMGKEEEINPNINLFTIKEIRVMVEWIETEKEIIMSQSSSMDGASAVLRQMIDRFNIEK